MGENYCKQPCERSCQVWQLAVSCESHPGPHLHMPCLPGGGRPGGGLTLRTYEGGCRSACSGSMTHPVQHFYPVGRMKKWFFDTKEWFWDGMFVMKAKNPTKSASHYCLPFPRPTMRLPRSCNSRLVEVHHIHPPPPTSEGVAPNASDDGPTPPQDSAKTQLSKPPQQEGSEGVAETEEGRAVSNSVDSNLPDSTTESQQASGDAQEADAKPPVVNQPRETDAKKENTVPNSGKVGRISHISVGNGSPTPLSPGGGEPPVQPGGGLVKHGDLDGDHPGGEFTYVDYSASSCCPQFCRRRCCQGTGCFPCIPAQWKLWVRRGVVCCFTLTARACLCLSFTCATMSFCVRKVARNMDTVATTAVDVKELFNCYVFVADMPGLKYSEIKVENDSVLKISGDQTRDDFAEMETEIKYVRVERNSGRLIRKFNLPADTHLDGISAACQDGLLTVIVPKTPQLDPHRPRSFEVNVHSASITPPVTTGNTN